MNKTVIVNIAGTIFHIDEDAYECLKEYNNTLRDFFRNHLDGEEIVNDIESRIAELFSEKLSASRREVIDGTDVNEIIARLGSVEDFYSEEASEEASEETAYTRKEENKNTSNTEPTPPKRLYRNLKNRVFGGVCSGLGDYLNVDPLWIRLIWIPLTFFYGMGFIVYIILWIIVPQAPLSFYFSGEETTKKKKRLYRNPQNKRLGGVCSGFASYFDIDPTWVRLIWIGISILLFFLLALYQRNNYYTPIEIVLFSPLLSIAFYVLLCIIMPKAKTLADQMAMKGEPDNLDGIVKNAEDKKKMTMAPYESGITRFFDTIFNAIISMFKFIFRFIGKVIGLMLILFPFMFIVGIVIASSLLLTDSLQLFTDIHLLSGWHRAIAIISGGILFIIPAVSLLFWGLKILSGRRLINGWVLFTFWMIWFIALIGASVITGKTAWEFRTEVEIEECFPLSLPKDNMFHIKAIPEYQATKVKIYRPDSLSRIFVRQNKFNGINKLPPVYLDIRRSHNDSARLIEARSAHGKEMEQAAQNAGSTVYRFTQEGQLLTFDRYFKLEEDALWRANSVRLILEIPVNTKVKLDREAARMFSIYTYGNYPRSNESIWEMTEEGIKLIPEETVNTEQE